MSKESPWLDEIPKVKEIFEEVINRNKWRDLPERIKADKGAISSAFVELEKECYDRYLEYEAEVKKKWKHKGLDVLEKSLSQSRPPRGGKSSELILHHLLTLSGMPAGTGARFPKGKEGERLDIIIPSKETMYAKPDKTAVISVKRKVRERWREVVGEAYLLREIHQYKGRIFFVTMEADLSVYAMKSLQKLNVVLYTPEKHSTQFSMYGVRPVSKLVGDLVDLMRKGELEKS
jgi:hypothetical protein